MTSYVKLLLRLAEGYRAAEAQVVKAYFRRRRKKSEHLRWLRAQAFKEYSAIKPLLTALAQLYPWVDRGMDRHQYEEFGEKLADETKHARLIMDLLEEVGGKKITPRELPWLPEDRKLARIRSRYSKTYAALLHGSGRIALKEIRRKDEELERAAVTLTEGGGGALYAVCSRLRGGSIEKRIASVFREIYDDEMKHKGAGAHGLAKLVRTPKDYEHAAGIIKSVSAQRLRMRNEQFGFPFAERQLEELERRMTNGSFLSP